MGNLTMRRWALLALCALTPTLFAAELATESTRDALPAYTQAEWDAQLAAWRREHERRAEEARRRAQEKGTIEVHGSQAGALLAPGTTLDSVTITGGAGDSDDAITNNQTQGVDEGGIVKRHGQHLVVLRRGRLFTLAIGEDSLLPVAAIDAFGPEVPPDSAWYDEMLIANDTIVVIGYSYERDATEVGLFDIDAQGGLAYRSTYYLRSGDYYSASNSASRLIGTTLVFYAPVPLNSWRLNQDFYPSTARLRGKKEQLSFQRILPTDRIYRSRDDMDPFSQSLVLHTLMRCDLATRELQCEATAVLGPESRSFYVSADSVFVWTSEYGRDDNARVPSSVFRLALDGGVPRALKTQGSPVDQLSFLQGDDGYLNVLLAAQSNGDAMWWGERLHITQATQAAMALLRVPLTAFGDARAEAKASDYRVVPPIMMDDPQNRFVGDWLIYNGGEPFDGDATDVKPFVHLLRYAREEPVRTIASGHHVERIEAMGRDAVLVGSKDEDLYFTSLRLGERPALTSRYVQRNAAQGETRTHGFFYKPTGDRAGMLGLPIMREAPEGMARYVDESAAITFLRNRGTRLSPMGTLEAGNVSERAFDDGCKSSCVDWYGNARPIFIGERVFALLGYELVEGQVAGGRIRERRRVDFSPARAR